MKKIIFTIITAITLSTSLNAQIVITEIMYNGPESGIDVTEFLELYNAGTTAVDMTGYNFTEGINYTFGATTIDPGAYFVLALSASDLDAVFGAGTADAEWESGALSNGGEDVILVDSLGTVVDTVDYDDNSPWPSEADGDGNSLALCDPISDNNSASNWMASTETTITFNTFNYEASPGQASNCPTLNNTAVTSAIVQLTTVNATVKTNVGKIISIYNILGETVDNENLSGIYFVTVQVNKIIKTIKIAL